MEKKETESENWLSSHKNVSIAGKFLDIFNKFGDGKCGLGFFIHPFSDVSSSKYKYIFYVGKCVVDRDFHMRHLLTCKKQIRSWLDKSEVGFSWLS